ncbi:AraC family transcriptional regulator [Pedobacter nyackensis]|uniref:AraC family transcriptional regulator n=1 Tax=Pedobacter nyackensis TaxID=475255 RepID=UPI0029318093|nr:AraC family transcriptional regulator [Pedobacter nyackensis]
MREKFRKKDGFDAQRVIVLPKKVLKVCESHVLLEKLYLTDIGFYPKAKFHYRERSKGISQNILIYCIDGKGWVSLHEGKVEVTKGQFLILPRDEPHVYGADEESPWSIFWIHFTGTLSSHLVHNLKENNNILSQTIFYDERRIETFNNIYKTLAAGYSLDKLNYATMQLWSFLSSFCYPKLFAGEEIKGDEIDRAIQYMQGNICKSITLREMATDLNRSPSHFSALFKKKTGYPPLEYFNHIKMQKACQQLAFTDIQIKELSWQLGYKDQFYFSRVFHKFMGQSPVEYRKRKKF